MQASDHPFFLQRQQLTTACVHWLLIGSALVLLLPAARGSSLWIGWLPYWLCVAPALCLILLQPHTIRRAVRQTLDASHRRRSSRRRGRQARRQSPRPALRSISLAALLGR